MTDEETRISSESHEEIRAAFMERNITIKEAVLKAWAEKHSAKSIMSVFHIDEAALEEIVPRNLWFYDHWKTCQKCNGEGGFSYTNQNINDDHENS